MFVHQIKISEHYILPKKERRTVSELLDTFFFPSQHDEDKGLVTNYGEGGGGRYKTGGKLAQW